MKPVQFIQYFRPNGRQERVEVDRPDDVADKAKRLWDMGYRLEIEVLSNGIVHMTISAGDDDLIGELAENGPKLLETIDRMILEFEI